MKLICAICGGKVGESVGRLNMMTVKGRRRVVHATCNLLRVAAIEEIDREREKMRGTNEH
jgi:hypothetical protein